MLQDKRGIPYWDPYLNRIEFEKVYGSGSVQFLYGTQFGFGLADQFLTRPWISKIVGAYQSSFISRKEINSFIKRYEIPMEDYDSPGFRSFNEFFIRKFKPGKRSFTTSPSIMPAFSEGRYFGFDSIEDSIAYPVKGKFLTPEGLLSHPKYGRDFQKGPMLICRLCPLDYHRFHFPDDGVIDDYYSVHGKLHSVNPVVFNRKPDVFLINERQVSILNTRHFGKLAFIEVGALCVGKIVQTAPSFSPFNRGDEKGYFLFGGSTVIVIGQPGRWKPDPLIVEKTHSRVEVYKKLGDPVASATQTHS